MISVGYLRAVEGQQVDVALADGTRLEGCSLVSVGRLWARTVWLLNGDTDLFISPEEIEDIFVLEHRNAA